MPSPWQELEIEPTGDVVAIRRAFRARLDRTQPEEAARLQAAYEGAIAALPLQPVAHQTVGANEAQAISRAIEDGDAIQAATLIARGRERSTLTLRHDIEAVERLMVLLATSPGTSHNGIRRIAATLGWLQDGGLPAGSAFALLRARLTAEDWLEGVRSTARRRRPFDARAAAARVLLGARPSLFRRLFAPRVAIDNLLRQLDEHQAAIGHRLDPLAIENARRVAGGLKRS